MNTVQLIDPPEGWRYGFPKPVPAFKSHPDFVKWMYDQGYPKELIKQGMLEHCRYITMPLPLPDEYEGTPV